MTPRRIGQAVAIVLITALTVSSARPGSAQTTATGRVMREKLAHSQRLLEAITTSNFALLRTESEALTKLTKDPAWAVLKTPEYQRYSELFLRASEDLAEAAKKRDLDMAAMHYMLMTMSCYQCHRYVKDMRIAQR